MDSAVDRRGSRLGLHRAAIGLVVVLVALIVIGAGYVFWKNYSDTEEQIRDRASSGAQVVAANIGWAYETAQQLLRRVDDSLGADIGAPSEDAENKLSEAIATIPGDVKVYVVDAAGVTRLTTDPQFRDIDVRDREYFSAVAEGERWHVSTLLVSRLNGEQIFTISKRLERNGAFAGAAILSFSADLMQAVWESLDFDTQSTVGLVRNDGQLVSRYPLPDGPIDLSGHVLFTDYLPAEPSGTYAASSPADGVDRIVGYRRIEGTNLIALASISTRAAFAALNTATVLLLALAVPAGLGLLFAGLWLLRLVQQDRQQLEMEAQFETVAEAMPNQVWTSRPDGYLDWFNSRILEYTGKQATDLMGSAWTQVVHDEDVGHASAAWAASLARRTPLETQFRIRGKDGGYRWHLVRAMPISDGAGNIERWIGTNTDIDEQKKSAQALEVSEARLRLAIQAGQLAVWDLDVATGSMTPSAALNHLYGFPENATPTAAEYTSRYAPGERERVERIGADSAARGETEIEVEVKHIWPDGTVKWLLIRAQTHVASDPNRVIGVVIDITDRRSVQDALEQSERRFRLSQQAAGIASLELDIATGTVLGSDHFWEVWGLTSRESIDISELEAIVLPEDQTVRSTAETRRNGTANVDAEYRIRRPDNGEIRWLSRHIEFIYDDVGQPTKMYGIIQDVTAQKEAQARQQMLTHELEHRIKNIMAMVSAIASRTLRNSDLETARVAFTERIQALARAHDILTSTKWTSASIADVVTATIVPLPSEQILVEGPTVVLNPKPALSLALAINELGTNALKYGALSVPQGRVTIEWSVSVGESGGRELRWRWSEMGGPAVVEPTRSGFGSFLITRVLGGDFGGIAKLSYESTGLICELTAPLDDGHVVGGQI